MAVLSLQILIGTDKSWPQIFFVMLYVLPFYLSPKTRPSPTLNRDAPSVIRARIQSVTFAVVISTVTSFYLLYVTGSKTLSTSLHHLGFYPFDPVSIVQSFILTLILYLAPLYESIYIDRAFSPISTVPSQIKASLASSQGYRNYIAGPLTEELLFRSSIITLHLLAHVSATKITFLTPLYFGVAHLHHFYEFKLTHSDTPVLHALFRSVFQFGFTTVFGWYASFIYVRTGNLYAVFVIHAFCNYMGLPRLWGRIKIYNEPSLSSFTRGKEDSDLGGHRSGQETPFMYTIVYYILLVGGIFGFHRFLFTLTSSSNPLASFGK